MELVVQQQPIPQLVLHLQHLLVRRRQRLRIIVQVEDIEVLSISRLSRVLPFL